MVKKVVLIKRDFYASVIIDVQLVCFVQYFFIIIIIYIYVLSKWFISSRTGEIVTSYDADVIALQELRWKGSSVLRGREDDADLYYSCQQNRHNLGCGFAVGSRFRELIILYL